MCVSVQLATMIVEPPYVQHVPILVSLVMLPAVSPVILLQKGQKWVLLAYASKAHMMMVLTNYVKLVKIHA